MRAVPDTRIVSYFRVGIDKNPEWFTAATINKFAEFVPKNKVFWKEEELPKGEIVGGKYYISTVFGKQVVPHGSIIIQTQGETFLSFCSYEHFCDKYTKLD